MMNKSSLIITIVFFLFIFSYASAQNDTKLSFSLKEAQEYAVKNSYSVKTSNIDVDNAKKTVALSTTMGYPHINGKVDYMDYFKGPITPFSAEKFNPMAPPGQLMELSFVWPQNATAGLTASQLIFDYSYILGIRSSKLYVELTKDNVKKSEIDIKDGVAQSYY